MTASSTPLYTLSLHDALPISFRNNQRPGYLNYWSPASTVRVTTRKFRQSLVSFISQLFEQTNLSGVVAKNRHALHAGEEPYSGRLRLGCAIRQPVQKGGLLSGSGVKNSL